MAFGGLFLKRAAISWHLVLLAIFCHSASTDAEEHFQVLRPEDIQVTSWQSGHQQGNPSTAVLVSFQAFGRQFRLRLQRVDSGLPVVLARDGKGDETAYQEDIVSIWKGAVEDDADWQAVVHLPPDGSKQVTGSLWNRISDRVIRIDPASIRPLDSPESSSAAAVPPPPDSVIVYRTTTSQDLIKTGLDYSSSAAASARRRRYSCAASVADDGPAGMMTTTTTTTRKKRRSPAAAAPAPPPPLLKDVRGWSRLLSNHTCPIVLVADYSFFATMGAKSLAFTSSYLVLMMERINRIFTSTEWKLSADLPAITGLGFAIDEIVIHTEPSSPTLGAHYNAEDRPDNASHLLELFSFEPAVRNKCLGHLFTDTTFPTGSLGMAYVAMNGAAGGICSNTMPVGGRMPQQENHHDDKNGRNNNNNNNNKLQQQQQSLNVGLTSIRSRRGSLMTSLEADLITAHELGHAWGSEHDPDTAECSPSAGPGGKYLMHAYSVSGTLPNHKVSLPYKNHGCCTEDCKVANGGKLCSRASSSECISDVHCDGISPICGSPLPLKDGAECFNKGQCLNGTCVSFCKAIHGSQDCFCSAVKDACKRCCETASQGCQPVIPNQFLDNGHQCAFGVCHQGKCKLSVWDMVKRKFSINGDPDEQGKVLSRVFKDCLVFWVVFLSALVWVPISCLISRHDARVEKEYQQALYNYYYSRTTQASRKEDSVVLPEQQHEGEEEEEEEEHYSL
ncbi:unnamed protein product [Notodromas monacha]|uniref:Peptidase M12B domain-containing protein n=1 Tax=Notodromas monacha TaxID=399045 RepID=A0A7R9BI58_9CRUS|nr:unnamed protein product [Notodromas monacha]CAG0914539.1 unnamed protein product [Notodromas monacha]